MNQKIQQRENAIVFCDAEKCLGCHSCELACAVAHGGKDLHTSALLGMTLRPRTKVVAVADIMMPVQCRQCEDAPCAFACPSGSIRQEEGLVTIQQQTCMGCKACVMVCPFGAISVKGSGDGGPARTRTNRGVAHKCDLCAGTGRETPACVEGCPRKALSLIDLEEYRQTLREARVAELAQSHKYLKKRKETL
ncbi:4Fe-4S dicluster domain-containing protein [Geomonas sp. RF6]|uniref:4Fe-4S dicluster domain-containing protein n=1 Tax=Geomonas sp. RF6 TaxID=2897342 RepID=UPI001E3E8389|nr:4Fe-4S dicluster domain-containing protein [Geomonas sp. RF6]UFS68552.1 4Fe-4S dicluster domain-containing protein [Geomonas sp. RF6]